VSNSTSRQITARLIEIACQQGMSCSTVLLKFSCRNFSSYRASTSGLQHGRKTGGPSENSSVAFRLGLKWQRVTGFFEDISKKHCWIKVTKETGKCVYIFSHKQKLSNLS